MRQMSLEQALSLFSAKDPVASIAIAQASVAHFQWLKTELEEANLKGDFVYHSMQGALKEAEELFQNLSLENCSVLYVYGVGLGYFYKAASAWLKENKERCLIFIEDDPALLHAFFTLPLAVELLADPQVSLYFLDKKNLDQEGQLFRTLTWNHLLKSICITALNAYAHFRIDDCHLVRDRLAQETVNKNTLLSEYLASSAPFYRNYFPNLSKLPHSLRASALFGKFHNVPALICGAGPSLQKHIGMLNELKKNACLFAGGTAMKLLVDAGVRPHFGGGIDPNPEQHHLYQQIAHLDFPFFYHPRLRKEALELVKGPKLYLSGTGGYAIGQWMDEQLGIFTEEMDEGHNVIHFLTQVALRLGCNPIIFLGMDLAFTGMDAEHGVLRKDIDGNPIYTQWKWIQESEWTSALARAHPERTWVNATEGGIGFKGIENKKLKELGLPPIAGLEKKITAALRGATMPDGVSEKHLQEILSELHQSLERCIGFLEILRKDSTRMRAEGKRSFEGLSGEGMLAYHDLIEEVAYPVLLEVYEKIHKLMAAEQAAIKQPEIWEAVYQAAQDIYSLDLLRN